MFSICFASGLLYDKGDQSMSGRLLIVGLTFRLDRIFLNIVVVKENLWDKCKKGTFSFKIRLSILSLTKPNFEYTLPRYRSAFTGEKESILYEGTRDKTSIAPFDRVNLRCTKAVSYSHWRRKWRHAEASKSDAILLPKCRFNLVLSKLGMLFVRLNIREFFKKVLALFTICANWTDTGIFDNAAGAYLNKGVFVVPDVREYGCTLTAAK